MKMIQWLLLTLCLSATTACGKKSERPDGPVTQQPADTVDPVDLDAVDAQTLDSTPCGNPDWSKLPPQSTAAPR